ncbi:septum formation initiator family protein [Anaerostipes sp. MSJ-23]|uniref:septum formation initiator family protein n=1 Tax=unclassified Anaerostipes TaxID=2635253 RepID=UPI00209F0266|nr:septum formation initiator family protein [Anaerostipes sp. MSJ-23]
MKKRTKVLTFMVMLFVICVFCGYTRLHQKSKVLEKEQKQVEADIRKAKKKKQELKEKKKYIKTREFVEKTATEKFGLLYPDEYLLKPKE